MGCEREAPLSNTVGLVMKTRGDLGVKLVRLRQRFYKAVVTQVRFLPRPQLQYKYDNSRIIYIQTIKYNNNE